MKQPSWSVALEALSKGPGMKQVVAGRAGIARQSACHRPGTCVSLMDPGTPALRETGASPKHQVRVRTRTLFRTDVSRRSMLRAGAWAGCAAALAGCANLGAGGARFDASDLSANLTLLVATTRKPTSGALSAHGQCSDG